MADIISLDERLKGQRDKQLSEQKKKATDFPSDGHGVQQLPAEVRQVRFPVGSP